jgi:hypothetical protein
MAAARLAGSLDGSESRLMSSIARRMAACDINSGVARPAFGGVAVFGALSLNRAESGAAADVAATVSTGDADVLRLDRVNTPNTTAAPTSTVATPAITGTFERFGGAGSLAEEILVGAGPTFVAGTPGADMMLVLASVATVCGIRSTACHTSRPNSEAVA